MSQGEHEGSEKPWQGAVLNASEEEKQFQGNSRKLPHPECLESFLPPDVGHEDHLCGALSIGTWPERPKGCLARGHFQCCRGRWKTPKVIYYPIMGSKILLSPDAGHKRPGVWAAGSNPAKRGQRSPDIWSCLVLQKVTNKTPGTSASLPGEKNIQDLFPPPTGLSCFPGDAQALFLLQTWVISGAS